MTTGTNDMQVTMQNAVIADRTAVFKARFTSPVLPDSILVGLFSDPSVLLEVDHDHEVPQRSRFR